MTEKITINRPVAVKGLITNKVLVNKTNDNNEHMY